MKFFAFCFILLNIFSSAQAQQREKADEYLNRYLELKRFNGTALVAKDQDILFSEGYGMANYETGAPIQTDTKFYIAGLTEQLTAYTALKVIEQYKLSLHSPIRDYIGDLKVNQAEKLSLHHLLSHTSGLPDYPLIHELPEKQFSSKDELVAYFEKISFKNEPGTVLAYSKLNYNLVGLILEKVTGKPFAQLLEEYVTAPLSMQNTSFGESDSTEKLSAKGYLRRNYEAGWEEAHSLAFANTFTAQGILSTTGDLLVWNTFLKNNYQKDKALKVMLTPHHDEQGYGFQIKKSAEGKIVEIKSIEAYSSGFNAASVIDLSNDLLVVVLGNNRNPSSGDIAKGLQAIFTGREYTLPLARKIVEVDSVSLKKLAGVYKVNEHFSLTILVEEGRLFVNDGMHPKFEVYPQSENQFFIEGMDAEILFIKNEQGEVTKLGLRNDGFTNAYAKKVTE